MNPYLRFLLLFLISSVSPCFAHHMAVIVDKSNPVGNLTSAHLAKIFRMENRKWTDGRDVVVVLHSASAGEKATLERLLKISDNEWQALVAAHKTSLKVVGSDSEALDFVESTAGAIGLVDMHSINGQINVVKVDGKLPTEAGYLPH